MSRPANRIAPAPRPGAHATDWTASELKMLRVHYPAPVAMPRTKLAALLPQRSWHAIVNKASELSLNRGHQWTEAETELLRLHYPTESAKGLANRGLRFTPAQIRQKAHLLGIRSTRPSGPPKGSTLSVPRPKGPTARERRAAEARERRLAKLLAPKEVKPAKALKVEPAPKPLPTPGVQANVRTPNLNAQKTAQAAKQKQATEKPKGYVSADMVRALPPTHPARQAYTFAAHRGMDAAQAAYHQVMSTLKQAA